MDAYPTNWAVVRDDSEFAALSAKLIQDSRERKKQDWKIVAEAVAQLGASELPKLKKVRRLKRLGIQLALDTESLSALANEVKEMASEAKLLFASSFPMIELDVLYSKRKAAGTLEYRPSLVKEDKQLEDHRVETRSVPTCATLILALDGSHAASKNLLDQSGIAAFRIDSVELLISTLTTMSDICAIVVDKSFLQQLRSDEQKELFQNLALYSSLCWIRVDDDGLKIKQEDVESILKGASCKSEISSHCISFRTGNLSESELPRITRACSLVTSSERGVALPAELSVQELRVVMAAAAEFDRDWKSDLPTDLKLQVRIIPGGRTSAKIVLARLNDRAEPFVVKVDKREFIHDEMTRFRSLIERIDTALQPRAVFHGGYGAIVFRLVERADQPARPAPTLERILSEIRMYDLYRRVPSLSPEVVAAAIENVIHKLTRLNSQRPPKIVDLKSYSSPNMSIFEELEANGSGFGMSEDAIDARRVAVSQYQRLDGTAVVHGDINLRNLLLLESGSACLIDYANCGPGHPAIDLVRLGCALLYGAFSLCMNLDLSRQLQELLIVDIATFEEIELRLPEVFRMSLNRPIVLGFILARDAALKVLRTYGGGIEDYQAAIMLVAWASLVVDGLQHSMARDTIEMLAEVVSEFSVVQEIMLA